MRIAGFAQLETGEASGVESHPSQEPRRMG